MHTLLHTVPPIFMLVATRKGVHRISLDTEVNDCSSVSIISGLSNTLALDYRLTGEGEGEILFADKGLDAIFASNLNGSGAV